MHRYLFAAPFTIASLASGCGKEKATAPAPATKEPTVTVARPAPPAPSAPPATPPAATPPPAQAAPPKVAVDPAKLVKVDGFGPVNAGLEWSVKAVKKAFPDLDVDKFQDNAGGHDIRRIIVFGESGPEAPLIRLTPEEKGTKLAEAAIMDETYKTAEGFGIGSTYADVKAAGVPCVVSSDILGNSYTICSKPDAQNVQLVIHQVDTGGAPQLLDDGQAPPEQYFPGTSTVSAILWYPPGSAEVKRRWKPAAK